MMRKILVLLLVLMAAPVMAQQSVIGRWMTADDGGVVALSACGTMICGAVDGITGFRPNGAPPLDVDGRSRCHLQIISDLVLEEPGLWAGHITNPDDGKTYSIHISLDPEGKLRMRGYIGIPLLGRTTVWTRYQGKLTPDCHLVRN
jgi:uncharacterized protein (DUF2147 family)